MASFYSHCTDKKSKSNSKFNKNVKVLLETSFSSSKGCPHCSTVHNGVCNTLKKPCDPQRGFHTDVDRKCDHICDHCYMCVESDHKCRQEICTNCKKRGHNARDCRKGTCSHCKKWGHHSLDCRDPICCSDCKKPYKFYQSDPEMSFREKNRIIVYAMKRIESETVHCKPCLDNGEKPHKCINESHWCSTFCIYCLSYGKMDAYGKFPLNSHVCPISQRRHMKIDNLCVGICAPGN